MEFQIKMLSKIMYLSYSKDLQLNINLNLCKAYKRKAKTVYLNQMNNPSIFYNNYSLIGDPRRFHFDRHLLFANIEFHQARSHLYKSNRSLHISLCNL